MIGLRRDGSTFPMELSIGEVTGRAAGAFTGFVRDLTERQETQQRLHELQVGAGAYVALHRHGGDGLDAGA